eukprot:CAMPEP_0202942352 /NCGR_PEP_ID=MMETSP1395-20130829/2519_1 /ASSEMBLY_ACC=CAM_ASM_000871 /TAXON_ID=5961 /ORGANISM="Blepharisma japonicum, Strain Stock R1072" /LENGTH=203 /DNA_ID=CAMNT_0049638481 /DNA_START=17 /DNA_END=629 /DNA_ORIENTATION=-
MPKGSRRRIYIGRLDKRTRARDLEDVFNRYGRIRDVELKRDYAFIEYYEPRDAEDAIRDMDGRKLDGSRVIVEWAGSNRSGHGSANEDTCFNCGQTGHWANNCKEGDWKDKCYRCGKKGHMKETAKAPDLGRDLEKEIGEEIPQETEMPIEIEILQEKGKETGMTQLIEIKKKQEKDQEKTQNPEKKPAKLKSHLSERNMNLS